MNTPETPSSSSLPSYITSAAPIPKDKRTAWYKSTAQTYAGIFLWFVFWQDIVTGGSASPSLGGTLAHGIGLALFALVVAALLSHFLFYVVPGLYGVKTGLPLYVVGTSTFGARGGFYMPGFLMGLLQFGWLGVNAFFSSLLIYNAFASTALTPGGAFPVAGHAIIVVIWGVLAAFVGLKGIQYVARVATFIPLIPLVILGVLLAGAAKGIGSFTPDKMIAAQKTFAPNAAASLSSWGVFCLIITYVVGFFATAGAAGVDFGMNNRDKRDVHWGGLIGIALAIIVTAGISLLIVAGVYGSDSMSKVAGSLVSTGVMKAVVGPKTAGVFMFLLALAAFPPACFASFIAANSFKTTLPNVNPFVSVGFGTLISIILAVTALAGKVIAVFVIIGASFGPICGAMMVDYLLAGGTWTGPRAGFNPAGWISWALGFIVGILPNLHGWFPSLPNVKAAPVAAFIVGAVVYFICAKLGWQTAVVKLPDNLAKLTGRGSAAESEA